MLAGQRSARNNIIMEVLRDYGYVDARGMGVRTKVLPLMKAGGKEPVFEVTEDYVKTILAKIKVQGEPLKGQYTYLKGHNSLESDREIRETPLSVQIKGHDDPINDLLNVLRTSPSADYQTPTKTPTRNPVSFQSQ